MGVVSWWFEGYAGIMYMFDYGYHEGNYYNIMHIYTLIQLSLIYTWPSTALYSVQYVIRVWFWN